MDNTGTSVVGTKYVTSAEPVAIGNATLNLQVDLQILLPTKTFHCMYYRL
jgi:hypothetical protein